MKTEDIKKHVCSKCGKTIKCNDGLCAAADVLKDFASKVYESYSMMKNDIDKPGKVAAARDGIKAALGALYS